MSNQTLRVLIVHNHYIQPGGEDVAVAAEADLLETNGHQVCRFETSNMELAELGRLRAAAGTIWSSAGRRRLAKQQALFRPDVMHFHNTFPLLSPSVYYAAQRPVAVVQTLHNYRLVCPTATLLRGGKPCEDCVGRFAWPGVAHACYRGSRSATLAAAMMVQTHRMLGTWTRKVDAYVALTPFARDVFIRGGLPASRIHVKPNFVAPDPGVGTERSGAFVFAGRFEEGKGIRVLLEAWRRLQPAPPLRIIGSGPLQAEVERLAATQESVEVVGRVTRDRVIEELKHARAMIAPMLWYENFPLSVCEALATGCPVIASDVRNVSELLGQGAAGVLFERGNAVELARAVEIANRDDELMQRAGRAGRALYEAHYTAGANYRALLGIYHHAASTARVSA